MSQSTLITRILDLIAEIEKGNIYQWDNDKRIIQAETLISLLDSKGYQAIVTARLDALAEISYDNARAKSRYNGWSNYETWCVELWLSNDYTDYTYLMEKISELDELYAIQSLLKETVENMVPELDASMFSDLINAGLSSVDWYELARHWFDDTDEDRKERNGDTDEDSENTDDLLTLKGLISHYDLNIENQQVATNPKMDADEKWMLSAKHYCCVLSYTHDGKDHQMGTLFSQGSGVKGQPTVESVLECLLSDAGFADDTYEEFLHELGYKNTPANAKTHRIIVTQTKELQDFLGDLFPEFLDAERD